MKIIVCIKQVPGTSEVEIDPVTGVLIRDARNTKMNPYDLYAIETALRIKGLTGATVTAISMGPPQAEQVLREALWMGCDDAVLLSDRKFAGADVVATSYALSSGIKKQGGFDLIVCGKQTTDGDTAQVGPEIAEHLRIPHISYVDRLVEIKDKSLVVSVSMDKTTEEWEIDFPCLITVDKGIFTPRLPSYKRGREFKDYKIKVLTFADMEDQDENHYGLKGSPTQVERMFPPERITDKEVWRGDSEELAEKMTAKLKELKVL
ncbi:MAG: electron transfer flavoprotein subunit beta/FixA family protein [Bacillota bacterium]|jgi:electron transfer flavoprotein beta subunit|nr:electron transfer flavoprotein subunit beta/FixA family protein [Bacillota bacterium]HOA78458.1 electron transfer flavoprotein subunit beta/FixA family protein [Bacilli bacterium]HQC89367.1 electron transfer flavoprotein subunit beta/FixA family protein [Bacilli bacterium]